jgi:hypothetical protein
MFPAERTITNELYKCRFVLCTVAAKSVGTLILYICKRDVSNFKAKSAAHRLLII